MFEARKPAPKVVAPEITRTEPGKPASMTLLTVVGEHARFEGKFDITDSIQIECEIAGEMTVGGKLVVGEKGVVNANVHTVDAIIMGIYEGNMIATGNVEIAETGRVTGNITTDSLVIAKGGFFNGNITKMDQANARQVVAIDEKRSDTQKQSQYASR
jgi:cytoskeletal protein CcmA (bactofilin family)